MTIAVIVLSQQGITIAKQIKSKLSDVIIYGLADRVLLLLVFVQQESSFVVSLHF